MIVRRLVNVEFLLGMWLKSSNSNKRRRQAAISGNLQQSGPFLPALDEGLLMMSGRGIRNRAVSRETDLTQSIKARRQRETVNNIARRAAPKTIN